MLIEACWPKRRILEVYLNVAEFGYGTYGAEAAAQRFFHKSAARLDARRRGPARSGAAEPAALAGERAPSRYVEQRRAWIEGQMQALGGPEMLDEIDAYPDRH